MITVYGLIDKWNTADVSTNRNVVSLIKLIKPRGCKEYETYVKSILCVLFYQLLFYI